MPGVPHFAHAHSSAALCSAPELLRRCSIPARHCASREKNCQPLESYTKFVQYVIFYKKSGEGNYVEKTLKRCEREGFLPDYFSELEKEEQTMIFGEYSYKDDIRVQRQGAFEDGIKQGISQGLAQQKAEDEKQFAQKDAEIKAQAKRIAELESQLVSAQK